MDIKGYILNILLVYSSINYQICIQLYIDIPLSLMYLILYTFDLLDRN